MNYPEIVVDESSPLLELAVSELRRAFEKSSHLPDRVVLDAKKNCDVDAEGYRLSVDGGTIHITGADSAGVLYGALDAASHFAVGGSTGTLKTGAHNPYIRRRGIKFNIPLDARTPGYADGGDSAQENIANVWDRDFWRGFLDRMARDKYNVLSLWNLSPFPSMVKIPQFPNAALADVKRAAYAPNGTTRGNGLYTAAQEQSLVTIKKMSIDEKIAFWREMMQYAADRCIDVYLFTWNIFVYGTSITDRADSDVTKAYVRAAVEALVRTYPLLRGIGVTAGENMQRVFIENVREDVEWIRAAYGQGIMNALKDTPDRDFTLIHRSHMTSVAQMEEVFADFPYDFELSYKYSMAHLYAHPTPHFGDAFFASLKNGRKTWLTLRADDFYLLRWGDAAFAREYLRALPLDVMQGFYLGPDGIVWGKDYAPRDSAEYGAYFYDRHWFSFAVWGQLAYDIDLGDAHFRALWRDSFGDDADTVFDALALASSAVSLQQRVFWHDFDFQWYPEAGVSYLEDDDIVVFRTINDFIDGKAYPNAEYLSVGDYCAALCRGEMPKGIAPPDVSNIMEENCQKALALLETMCGDNGTAENALVADIAAMSMLGLHYAYIIRAAVNLCRYRDNGDEIMHQQAIADAQRAAECWLAYSSSIAKRYRPQRLGRLRNAVSPDMFDGNALFDVVIAQNG